MPLAELGWILEVIKLLGRFAPLADRLVTRGSPQLPATTIDALDMEIQDELATLRSRLEAPMNDLRKRVQEQNLRLHQIQEELHSVQSELHSTLKLTREIMDEMAALRLWLFVTLGTAGFCALLLVFLLLRH
jgi:hypothetical protein